MPRAEITSYKPTSQDESRHRGRIASGLPTSMISPCQEGKNSPDALGGSANKSLQVSPARLRASRRVVPLQLRTRMCVARRELLRVRVAFIESCRELRRYSKPCTFTGAELDKRGRLAYRPVAKTGLKLEIPATSGFVLERSVNP